MKKLGVVLVFFVTALLLTFTAAPVAWAWGATDVSIKQVNTFAFVSGTGTTWSPISMGLGSRQRYCTAGTCQFMANVDLPSGAQIVALEIDGCDTSPTAQIATGLYKNGRGGGAETTIVTAGTTNSGTPGCDAFTTTLTTPETIDNFNNSYFVAVHLGPQPINGVYVGNYDTTTTFAAIRIYYQLQISPAPATNTFIDVPVGAPFFQEIEALNAAGITHGCPAPYFCPDDFVTRGQMAAFLSRALGLYWLYQ